MDKEYGHSIQRKTGNREYKTKNFIFSKQFKLNQWQITVFSWLFNQSIKKSHILSWNIVENQSFDKTLYWMHFLQRNLTASNKNVRYFLN